jgi:hypothetical protein
VQKGEGHLTVKDSKKEPEISEGTQDPDKKTKVFFVIFVPLSNFFELLDQNFHYE